MSVLANPTGPGLPSALTADTGVTTLVDELLAEQRHLTAVDQFSRHHPPDGPPSLESHYRNLIPLTQPRPGEQYAFEVDLDRCSGCKGCVTACHSLNGLEEEESWRDIGLLVGEMLVRAPSPISTGSGEREEAGPRSNRSFASPFSTARNRVIPLQQTVTTACHHCVEPGCLLGCPVLAYDKDPVTGIVRHLDDQCIGCSYCILKCPYDVPKYSARRGIVRKCDLCHDRLAEGEAPACVQACPNEAIRIRLIQPAPLTNDFRPRLPDSSTLNSQLSTLRPWLPDSPDPAYTLPTTRYLTSRPAGVLLAADHSSPKTAPAHWPLVFMLVLTQAGLGTLFAGTILAGRSSAESLAHASALAASGFALLAAGLLASVFHLGQPRKAWRIWLGWRTSWLSREAIALNLCAGAAALTVVALGVERLPLESLLPAAVISFLYLPAQVPAAVWSCLLLLTAVPTLFAQTMVYADTHRLFWRFPATAMRFCGTTILLGLAALFALEPSPILAGILGPTIALKLAVEAAVLKHARSDSERWTALRRTAVLQLGPLRPVLAVRWLLGVFGGILLPFLISVGASSDFGGLAWGLLLFGELAERCLFFTSVSPDKMPGSLP